MVPLPGQFEANGLAGPAGAFPDRQATAAAIDAGARPVAEAIAGPPGAKLPSWRFRPGASACVDPVGRHALRPAVHKSTGQPRPLPVGPEARRRRSGTLLTSLVSNLVSN